MTPNLRFNLIERLSEILPLPQVPTFAVPKAFYWYSSIAKTSPPPPSGGHIGRKEPYEECPTWEPKP